MAGADGSRAAVNAHGPSEPGKAAKELSDPIGEPPSPFREGFQPAPGAVNAVPSEE